MVYAGGFRAIVYRFRYMLIATVPGLMLGLWLLDAAPVRASVFVLGLVLMEHAVFRLCILVVLFGLGASLIVK